MTLIHPSADEVYKRIDQAIAQLLEKDYYLLQIDANERAISHRLGLYLQLLFTDWHVDCEYNRNLDQPKRLEQYEEFFDAEQRVWSIAVTDPITVFPDIIIHERGTGNNLLVLEMKKTTSKVRDDFDRMKLNEFKNQYGYPYALFIKFTTGVENIEKVEKEYLP